MPPWLWFVAAGTVALGAGLLAVYAVHAPLWLIFVLLPTSMLMFDPSPVTLIGELVRWLVVFGGSFLLYGTVGWLIGSAVQDRIREGTSD